LPRDSVAHPVKALGLYIAGHHRVDRSVVWRKLDRRGVHEAELAGPARTIMGPPGVASDRARDRGRHDNAPFALGLHGWQASFDCEEGAFEVGAEDLILSLGRQFGSFAAGKIPALAHRMSMPPNCAVASVVMRCASGQLETSAASAEALPPAALISFAVARFDPWRGVR
jgi:hypothetical protein